MSFVHPSKGCDQLPYNILHRCYIVLSGQFALTQELLGFFQKVFQSDSVHILHDRIIITFILEEFHEFGDGIYHKSTGRSMNRLLNIGSLTDINTVHTSLALIVKREVLQNASLFDRILCTKPTKFDNRHYAKCAEIRAYLIYNDASFFIVLHCFKIIKIFKFIHFM